MSDTLDAACRERAAYNRLRCRRFSGSGHIGFSFIPETGRSRATCTWNESQISASFGSIPCVSLKAEASERPKSTQTDFVERGMSTSPSEFRPAMAQQVTVTDDALIVDLVDGRTVSVPVSWYPRLAHGTPAERSNWRLLGRGEGIHWPDLDEDISVAGLLAGRPSGETQSSLQRWLKSRR